MRNKAIIAGILSTFIGVALPLAVFAGETIQENSVTNPGKPELVESGTVEVQGEQLRLIIGGSKGKGVLHFNGKDYPFTFSGNSVGGIGATKIDAVGTVYNLKGIEDFPGTYSGMGVGAVAVKGTGASSWENNKGVVVQMRAKSAEGLALNMGINVAKIELIQQ